jgi:hypothetical protein
MTGGDIPIGDFTYPVTGDLSTKQYYAVYMATGTTLAVCPTGNYGMLGILQDNPNATSTGVNKTTVGLVRELGHSKCWVDTSNIVAGSPLKISATAGVLALGTVGSDVIVAIACETNSNTSCIIEVALTARTAQGTSSRAGHLVFSVPMVNLGTGGAAVNVVTGAVFGATGTVTNMYAIPSTVASSSGATVLTAKITGTVVTTLSCTCTNANLKTLGTTMPGVAATALNSFGPTDTLQIISTSSVTFVGDTGTLEIHVITN